MLNDGATPPRDHDAARRGAGRSIAPTCLRARRGRRLARVGAGRRAARRLGAAAHGRRRAGGRPRVRGARARDVGDAARDRGVASLARRKRPASARDRSSKARVGSAGSDATPRRSRALGALSSIPSDGRAIFVDRGRRGASRHVGELARPGHSWMGEFGIPWVLRRDGHRAGTTRPIACLAIPADVPAGDPAPPRPPAGPRALAAEAGTRFVDRPSRRRGAAAESRLDGSRRGAPRASSLWARRAGSCGARRSAHRLSDSDPERSVQQVEAVLDRVHPRDRDDLAPRRSARAGWRTSRRSRACRASPPRRRRARHARPASKSGARAPLVHRVELLEREALVRRHRAADVDAEAAAVHRRRRGAAAAAAGPASTPPG